MESESPAPAAWGNIILLYPNYAQCSTPEVAGMMHHRGGEHIESIWLNKNNVRDLVVAFDKDVVRRHHQAAADLRELNRAQRIHKVQLEMEEGDDSAGVGMTSEPSSPSMSVPPTMEVIAEASVGTIHTTRALLRPLHVSQAVQTPTTGTVVKGLFWSSSSTDSSLLEMARKTNPSMLSLWAEHNLRMKRLDLTLEQDAKKHMGRDKDGLPHCIIDSSHCNIFMLDFYQVGSWRYRRPSRGPRLTAPMEGDEHLTAAMLTIEMNLDYDLRWA